MFPSQQLSLFPLEPVRDELKTARSGSFVDNLSLPIHRWFRYSAGFSAEWVEILLADWGVSGKSVILDPFAGSGTVSLVADKLGLASVAVEAHPFVARLCRAKLHWPESPAEFLQRARQVMQTVASPPPSPLNTYPELIQRSFTAETLAYLDALKAAWQAQDDQSPLSEMIWLAITAILRSSSTAGTAQWQYILPNKQKKKVLHPAVAFAQQIELMAADMGWMQRHADHSTTTLVAGDARQLVQAIPQKVDYVITSPPYANNYDYADALRFEMMFWGDVLGWGDMHDKIRKYLIVSSSQHASKEKLEVEELLSASVLEPIREELTAVVHQLAEVRQQHGGKKHYHTMVAAYCNDIGLVLQQSRAICRMGAKMAWVIGDSAPYGVYCPIDQWIGKLALAAGFTNYQFEKLRDRNTKWKNRKHQVPLHEGILWIEG